MKMVKNAVLAAAALIFGTSAFAETKFKAYNKLSSDTVTISHDDVNDEDERTIAGFTNKIYAEVFTDKVDAMIDARIAIEEADLIDEDGDEVSRWSLSWEKVIHDWYVEVRPTASITLGFHDNIYAEGTYLPIYDDNLSAGNIGSDGFTFVFTPAVNNGFLRLGATLPFTTDQKNWLNGKESDEEGIYDNDGNLLGTKPANAKTLNFGIGAIADLEAVQLGFTVQDVLDSNERTFGIYADMPGFFGLVDGLSLGAGIAISETSVGFDDFITLAGSSAGVMGSKLFNVQGTFETDSFTLIGEVVTNLKNDDEVFDLYTAVSVGFALSDNLDLTVTGKLLTDLSDKDDVGYEAKNAYGTSVTLDWAFTEHNSFEAEVDVNYCDGSYDVCFPVYWKYTF